MENIISNTFVLIQQKPLGFIFYAATDILLLIKKAFVCWAVTQQGLPKCRSREMRYWNSDIITMTS